MELENLRGAHTIKEFQNKYPIYSWGKSEVSHVASVELKWTVKAASCTEIAQTRPHNCNFFRLLRDDVEKELILLATDSQSSQMNRFLQGFYMGAEQKEE